MFFHRNKIKAEQALSVTAARRPLSEWLCKTEDFQTEAQIAPYVFKRTVRIFRRSSSLTGPV
jgi:hypothetical protein